jgi:glycosyltransferase involved in cell wall biosynthesis
MITHSLTIIVPCYNEEERVQQAISDLLSSFSDFAHPWEILVVDDCSIDRTNELAQAMVAKNPQVRLIKNNPNRGLGGTYRVGVENSRMTHSVLFPGDNEINAQSVRKVCDHIGEADIITSYSLNPELRKVSRRVISKVFTFLVNCICLLRLRYYNGPIVQSRDLLAQVDLKTNSFAYQAEIMIQMLKLGFSYKEYPFSLNYQSERTRVLNVNNFMVIGKTLIQMALVYWSPNPSRKNSDSLREKTKGRVAS